MEDNLIIPTKPEFKIHTNDHFDYMCNKIIEMHRKRMDASHIAFHMNIETSLVKDILEYIKTNEYASK